MANGGLGAVEVQKDTRPIWYCGFVKDVGPKDELLIGFEDDIWPPSRYAPADVRRAPRYSTLEFEKFTPKVGEEVEVRLDATPHAPVCWAIGTVGKIKHDFFVVSIHPSAGQKGNDQIVEKEKLRPVAVRSGLTADALNQETFQLPAGLQSWMTTDDGLGCFSHIQDQSGLVTILVQSSKLTLKLLGDKKATQRAKLLLEVHIKHQSQIQNFQDVREKRLKALENKRNRIEGSGFKHSCEFTVDHNFIPRIIGKGGDTIRALREKYDVQIKILEPGEEGRQTAADHERVVRIFGNNAGNVQNARTEVEYVEEAMPLEEDQCNWLAGGKGMRSIWSFKEAAGLVYARLEYDSQQLLLCGTRSCVEDAIALFETHFMYCPVFRQMDEEMENLFAELESYGDYDARWESWREEPKAKGSGKGEGKSGKNEEKEAKGYIGQNGSGRWESREAKEVPPSSGGRWDKRKAERGDARESGTNEPEDSSFPERSQSSREGKGGKKQREVILAPEPKGGAKGDEGKATRRRPPPVGSGEDGDALNGRARRGKMGIRS